MDKASRNAGVYRGLSRSTLCTPERKGGYKDKEEEGLTVGAVPQERLDGFQIMGYSI